MARCAIPVAPTASSRYHSPWDRRYLLTLAILPQHASMRILLLNPPSENTILEAPNGDGRAVLEPLDFGVFPPLGLLYVMSYLEQNSSGYALFLRDCVAEGITQSALRGVVEEARPDVVGITSFTLSLVDVCLAARTVREIAPQAHICMGGHHAIAFPYEAAQLKEFDSIVVGEGEVAFAELVSAIGQRREITKIPGVYTAESIARHRDAPPRDKRFLTQAMVPPAYIEDVDSLPFPARSYVRHIDYHSIIGVSSRLASIVSSRGCPYHCTFCDVPYRRYRPRAMGGVVDEVEECLSEGYEEVRFWDDLFNITPERLVSFCDEVLRRGLEFPWEFRGRVDAVTPESLERAKCAGLRMVSLGVETGTDEGLKRINKGITTAQATNAFRWCRELGIRTVADFMLGFPFEKTAEDIERSVEFLSSLDPDYAQFTILRLLPNTELFNEAAAKGIIDPQRWVDFALNPEPGFRVDHWEEHLSMAELLAIQRQGYRRFYLRPRYICRTALGLSSWYELKAKVGGLLKVMGMGR